VPTLLFYLTHFSRSFLCRATNVSDAPHTVMDPGLRVTCAQRGSSQTDHKLISLLAIAGAMASYCQREDQFVISLRARRMAWLLGVLSLDHPAVTWQQLWRRDVAVSRCCAVGAAVGRWPVAGSWKGPSGVKCIVGTAARSPYSSILLIFLALFCAGRRTDL